MIAFRKGLELRVPYGRETQRARIEGVRGETVILRRRHSSHGWNKETDRWERVALERCAMQA